MIRRLPLPIKMSSGSKGSFAHRRRLELRPFGSSFPKSPKVIRQWPLPTNSTFLGELRERRLTKYIGHWARNVPAAGMGRTAADDEWAEPGIKRQPAADQNPNLTGRLEVVNSR
jgi:hypothetical protein